MIKARHIWFYVKFFNLYTKLNFRWHFSGVRIINTTTDQKLPVLLIANHSSWWDGFFALYVNNKILHRQLHIMMLEEQLIKRMFLNKAGAFSIKKGTRDVLLSLDYAAQLLTHEENMLAMFPQGEIQSSYTYPIIFEKGIIRLIHTLKNPVQLVFAVFLIDYFSNKKPMVSIYLQDYQKNNQDVNEIETGYNRFYHTCIEQQNEEMWN